MITLHKLTDICHLLNKHNVNYVVIGGCAIFIHGYERTTQDIDLLIDADEENVGRIKKALQKILPEACHELNLDDVIKNVVVRMVGENLIVDLIQKVGDFDYKAVKKDFIVEEINDVKVPVASLESMLKLKQGIRDIDKKDYIFLLGKKQYLEQKKKKT